MVALPVVNPTNIPLNPKLNLYNVPITEPATKCSNIPVFPLYAANVVLTNLLENNIRKLSYGQSFRLDKHTCILQPEKQMLGHIEKHHSTFLL